MEMKKCAKCGKVKPQTSENFQTMFDKRDGVSRFHSQCRQCSRDYAKKRREENPDIIKKQKAAYYEKNKEQLRMKTKQWKKDNPEKVRQYIQNNQDKTKEQRKKYQEENSDRIAAYRRAYKEQNADEIRKRNRYYYYENREKIKDYQNHYGKTEQGRKVAAIKTQRRRAKKAELPATLTPEQWKITMDEFNNKCCYCGKKRKLTQDHFIPLSKGGWYTHNNIVPSCGECNINKSNKDFAEWYPTYEFYSKQREKKILKFLHYDIESGLQQLTVGVFE